MEKWEIYAHAVHDFMKKMGGWGDVYQANREKLKLQNFLWGVTNEIEVNGKKFYWPPRPEETAKYATSSKKAD